MFWESSGKEITYCQWLIVCENGHTCCDIYIEFREKWPFKILIVLINHWLSTKMVPSTIFSCNQAALRTLLSVRLTPLEQCPSHRIIMNFQELLPLTKVMSTQKVQVKSQRSMSQRSRQILPQFGCFRTVTPVWIYQWLWNDAQSLELHRRGALLFFNVIYSNIKVTQDKKIADFDPNWAFPDCNSSLNRPWLWNDTQSLK